MKTTCKVWMALAAALLLFPAAYAQTPVQYQHEKYDLKDGVGYNKYLVSTTPNENSEYTLRLETFVTGSVESSALPTDFILVLDNSGSMYYDYRPVGYSNSIPNRIALDNATFVPFFVQGYGDSDETLNFAEYVGATYNSVYTTSTIGATVSSGKYFYDTFKAEGTHHLATRFYKYEDSAKPSNNGYYRIFQVKSGNYYNLAIKLADGTYKYLYGSTIQDSPNTTINATNKIIYNGTNMYHLQSRKEAMMAGVRSFLDLIETENAKDQWKDGVTKHQVAVVSFSYFYPNSDTPSINEVTAEDGGSTKVIKAFTQVASADAIYNAVRQRMSFRGPQTSIDRGVHLAKMLFEDLQTKENGKYAALNSSGGVLRKKVAVVFTDGEPYMKASNGTTDLKFFQIAAPAVKDGKVIKEVGIDKINGRIYSIDLRMTTSSKDFLDHLSSNYPKGDCNNTTGNYTANQFTGKKVPLSQSDVSAEEWKYLKDETAVYYKDQNDGDLSSVFANIASSNMGQQAGEKLVVMDVMSDSFELPQELSGKVKFYTAQCIGEKEIDGKKYLAFAKEIPVDLRPTVPHLWVTRTEGTGENAEIVWHDLGDEAEGRLDIDNGLTYDVTNNGKSITVKGFEFVDLWCGKDEIPEHNYTATAGNTRHEIADDDPNKDYAADGYRGFKLIIEFPIQVSAGAVGGTGVPTNNELQSGLYGTDEEGDATGDPIINYQKPELTIPVQLAIRKDGLKVNESASFTVQRRTMVDGSEWEDYTTFVLTCTADNDKPMIKLLNLNPDYYYRVKENGWTWAYSDRWQIEANFPTTEDPDLSNPIVITNTPKDDTPKHAEAVKRNELKNY